jgi:hypothetical protein
VSPELFAWLALNLILLILASQVAKDYRYEPLVASQFFSFLCPPFKNGATTQTQKLQQHKVTILPETRLSPSFLYLTPETLFQSSFLFLWCYVFLLSAYTFSHSTSPFV